MYLSKLVGEITNEVCHNLHEICQIGCLILNLHQNLSLHCSRYEVLNQACPVGYLFHQQMPA